MGSPPLAREQPVLYQIIRACIGITPARAGTTPTFATYNHLVEDHPRSRGNNPDGGGDEVPF